MLANSEYVADTRKLIKELLKEKKGDVVKLEWIKYKVREWSRQFSSRKSKNEINKLNLFEKKLIQYNEMLAEIGRLEKESTQQEEEVVLNSMTKENILKQMEYCNKEREELIELKVRGAMLRARKDWYMYGEKPSKYYFGLESQNYKRKNRYKIKNKDGEYVVGLKNVLDEQYEFYEKLYKKGNDFHIGKFERFMEGLQMPTVTQKDREELEKPFTMAELRKVVFSSKKNTVPGSDGLSNEFYQVFFPELSQLLLKVCNKAATEGLHVTARQGVVALIEKLGKDSDYLKNWRPLSLLNCDGKFYAKMLALRLENPAKYLIHPDQTGFLKGRSINENLIDIMSVLDLAEHRQEEMLLISFDFEKAFDMVGFEYIETVLKRFGFGPNFCTMIMNALTGMSCCTINGGFASKYMKVERGLRQGSPISPILFDLAVEPLGAAIRHNCNIEGIILANTTLSQKKHGQYADDLWAAIKATPGSLSALMGTFGKFSEFSGLQINMEKSQILQIGNVREPNAELKKEAQNMQWCEEINILGILFSADRACMLQSNYGLLMEKMRKTLEPWRARSSTLMGKVQIVNSLMLSQAVYKLLTINSPSNEATVKIRKMITEFLWDKKKPRIAYETLIKGKKEGGLGLVDLRKKDVALKSNWCKKAYESKNVWIQIADELLLHSFIQLVETNLSKKKIEKWNINQTWVVTSILKAWSELHYSEPKEKSDIMNQVLWYNVHIRREQKPFIVKKMYRAGIKTVHDIFDDHALKFHSYDEIMHSFGNIGSYLDYASVVNSIPQEWKKKPKAGGI